MKTILISSLALFLGVVPLAGGGSYYRSYTPYRSSYFSYYPTLPTYSYYSYPVYSSYSYPTYSYPTYSYPTYTTNNYTQPAAKAPADWKTQLLELARERDKVEGTIRKNAAEYTAFTQALKVLGLEGNFRFEGYGGYPAPTGYGVNRNPQLGTYGSNGQTIYGYTYSSVKDLYGDNNLNERFQEANRLAMNAQTLGGQATQQFQQTVATEGNNRARVAEILARAQAASEALKAAQPAPQQTETSSAIKIEQQTEQGQGARSAGRGQTAEAFVKLATDRCLRCHGPDKQEGKFDVRGYQQMSLAEKAKRVWPRLTHPDENKRMPREGKALAPEELLTFYGN
jgi:hypothetical protein